jgi:hypothetical protein
VQLIGEYLSNHAILAFSMATKIMEAKDEVWNKTNHFNTWMGFPRMKISLDGCIGFVISLNIF